MPTAAGATEALLDPEFLKKLEYLHIVSKKILSGQFRAERTSRKRGSGLEFADHRGYSAGDDFRHIDWKAFQRLGRLLLRLYEEDQDLPIYVLIDASKSMADGTPTKLDYARQVAAALCFIGLSHLDKVTLVSYSNRIESELHSQRGKRQVFKLFRFLSEIQPAGETNAREAFRVFASQRHPRGVAVVISDFMDPAGFEAALNVLRFSQHDVFAVHVTRRTDASPDLKGDVRLVDAETGHGLDVAVTPQLLERYRAAYEAYCEEISRYCAKYRFGYVRTFTELPFEDVILQVFRQGRFLA